MGVVRVVCDILSNASLDESPSACHLFVENGGLDLYIRLLKVSLE